MKILFNSKFFKHNISSQYEGAYRINDFKNEKDVVFDGEPYIGLVHSERYIEQIKEACINKKVLAEIYFTPESYEAACLAVGLTIKASEQNDFAVVRPPGHHASYEKASGFCLFNNIAIASQKLVNEGKKVFILDFDGHHGDGTQSIFYESNKVFYCSIHQENIFPFSGTPMEIGKGEGLGYTLNLPLRAGSGEKEFLAIVDKIIERALKFKPDVVGVSAGFDGYRKDKILGLVFSLHSYYECGYKLSKSFKNVFAVLEGGYHEDMKECVDIFIEGINIGAKPSKIKWNPGMSIG